MFFDQQLMQRDGWQNGQIGIWCSGTRKCSQRYEMDHFCWRDLAAIRSWFFEVSECVKSLLISETLRCSLRRTVSWIGRHQILVFWDVWVCQIRPHFGDTAVLYELTMSGGVWAHAMLIECYLRAPSVSNPSSFWRQGFTNQVHLRRWNSSKLRFLHPKNQGDVACVPSRKSHTKLLWVYAECLWSVICVLWVCQIRAHFGDTVLASRCCWVGETRVNLIFFIQNIRATLHACH